MKPSHNGSRPTVPGHVPEQPKTTTPPPVVEKIEQPDVAASVASPKSTNKKAILTLGFPEEVAEDVRFVAYVKGVSLSQFVLSKITLDAEVQAVLAARTRRSG